MRASTVGAACASPKNTSRCAPSFSKCARHHVPRAPIIHSHQIVMPTAPDKADNTGPATPPESSPAPAPRNPLVRRVLSDAQLQRRKKHARHLLRIKDCAICSASFALSPTDVEHSPTAAHPAAQTRVASSHGKSAQRSPSIPAQESAARTCTRFVCLCASTCVPAPGRRVTSPIRCSSSTAFATVMRDASNIFPSSASLGSRSPAFNAPDWMSHADIR